MTPPAADDLAAALDATLAGAPVKDWAPALKALAQGLRSGALAVVLAPKRVRCDRCAAVGDEACLVGRKHGQHVFGEDWSATLADCPGMWVADERPFRPGELVRHKRFGARAIVLPYTGIGEGGAMAGTMVKWVEPAGDTYDAGDGAEVGTNQLELVVRGD